MKRILMMLFTFLIIINIASARDFTYHYFLNVFAADSLYVSSNVSYVSNDSLFVSRGGYIKPLYTGRGYEKVYLFDDAQIKDFARIYSRYFFSKLYYFDLDSYLDIDSELDDFILINLTYNQTQLEKIFNETHKKT